MIFRLIIRQTNWGILGSIFAFLVGFLVKTYVIREVGTYDWGRYATAHIFVIICDTLLSIGIPAIILKFFPNMITNAKEDANKLLVKILRYSCIVSILYVIFMFLFCDILDIYLYPNTPNFSFILLCVSFHVPLSLFLGVISSLYRSILKIKELILYGTLISVSLRAVLTFFVFQYSNNILYFIGVELLTQSIVLFLLYYLFSSREINIFSLYNVKGYKVSSDIYSYGKKMYANSIISLSTLVLSALLGIMLPPEKMGVYSILLSITAFSMFLNKNLRKVFAPVISKLFASNKINELHVIYKETTFLVNVLTFPLSILIVFFSDEILDIFSKTGELLQYKMLLFSLICARLFGLLIGNSGILMIMAGLEKQELIIQSFRAIFSIILAILFINEYELFAVVTLFCCSIFFVTLSQMISIKRSLNITPFSSNLFFLVLVSVPLLFIAVLQDLQFNAYDFILYPTLLYGFYFFMFYNKILSIYKKVI